MLSYILLDSAFYENRVNAALLSVTSFTNDRVYLPVAAFGALGYFVCVCLMQIFVYFSITCNLTKLVLFYSFCVYFVF